MECSILNSSPFCCYVSSYGTQPTPRVNSQQSTEDPGIGISNVDLWIGSVVFHFLPEVSSQVSWDLDKLMVPRLGLFLGSL